MNICIVTHTFPKFPDDSTAAFMHPFVQGLIYLKCRATVLTPYCTDLNTRKFSYPIRVYRYIWPRTLHVLGYSQTLVHGTHLRISSWILAPLLFVSGTISLIRLLRSEKFDVISAHWIIPNGIIAAVAARICNIPFSITLPGSDVYIARKNKLFSFLTRWAAHEASWIFADSPQYAKELRLTGARPRHVSIIPYPVDISAIRPSRKIMKLKNRLGIPGHDLVIVSVGRLVEKKGFEYSIRAFAYICKKIPNAWYVICGDGDLDQELKHIAREAGIAKRVIFCGNIKRHDVADYYNLADCIIVPSIRDSGGNIDDRPVSMLESMACARPVIASDLPGNALTIDHGKNGFLVKPKNISQITRYTLRVLRSASLRRRLGKNARRKVVSSFQHTTVAQKYVRIYNSLIL